MMNCFNIAKQASKHASKQAVNYGQLHLLSDDMNASYGFPCGAFFVALN